MYCDTENLMSWDHNALPIPNLENIVGYSGRNTIMGVRIRNVTTLSSGNYSCVGTVGATFFYSLSHLVVEGNTYIMFIQL